MQSIDQFTLKSPLPYVEFKMTTSYQTLSSQFQRLTGQINFGQTVY